MSLDLALIALVIIPLGWALIHARRQLEVAHDRLTEVTKALADARRHRTNDVASMTHDVKRMTRKLEV